MKVLKLIVILIVIASCSRDDENTAIIINTLEDYVSGKTIETGAVIACAASENNTNAVLTFFTQKKVLPIFNISKQKIPMLQTQTLIITKK